MAGEWIKMRGNLWDDPRVARICEICDCSEAAAVGGLYWLWAAADQHSEDGMMPGLTLKSIDRKTGIASLGKALAVIGWVIEHTDGTQIVRFDEHNGKSAKRRCSEAVRKMSARDADKVGNEFGDDADGLQQSCAPRGREEEEGIPISPEIGLVGKSSRPPCPQSQIVAMYHELLPACQPVKEWTDARQAMLRTRWNENPKRQNLDWWRRYFAYVAQSKFLTGQVDAKPGRDPFVASLEWLIKPSHFVHVIEGKYHDKDAA